MRFSEYAQSLRFHSRDDHHSWVGTAPAGAFAVTKARESVASEPQPLGVFAPAGSTVATLPAPVVAASARAARGVVATGRAARAATERAATRLRRKVRRAGPRGVRAIPESAYMGLSLLKAASAPRASCPTFRASTPSPATCSRWPQDS